MAELEIQYVPVDKIKPYERNARRHGEKDIAAIKSSIEQFGFDDPVGIWGPDNIVVEGHGRLLAAKELGMETVPCIRLDHLTSDQRRAYALAHNKTAELSGWDYQLMEEEIAELTTVDLTPFFGDLNVDSEAMFDDLFTDSEPKEKEPKRIQCPHCGEWFEI